MVGDLPLLEQQQGGDGADAELGGQVLMFVNVDFADADAAIVLLGELVQNRSQHFAGPAPFGPEIHQNRLGRLDYFFGEVLLGQNHDIGSCHKKD